MIDTFKNGMVMKCDILKDVSVVMSNVDNLKYFFQLLNPSAKKKICLDTKI